MLTVKDSVLFQTAVVYDPNVLGTKGPRKMSVLLPVGGAAKPERESDFLAERFDVVASWPFLYVI